LGRQIRVGSLLPSVANVCGAMHRVRCGALVAVRCRCAAHLRGACLTCKSRAMLAAMRRRKEYIAPALCGRVPRRAVVRCPFFFFFFLTGRFVRPHRRILPITAIEPCPRGPSAHVAVQMSPKLPKRASAGSRQSMRHSRRRSDGKVVDVDEARTQRHSRRRSYRRGHRCRRRGACDKVVATHMIFISYDVNNVKY